jgi:hypothetical protein
MLQSPEKDAVMSTHGPYTLSGRLSRNAWTLHMVW